MTTTCRRALALVVAVLAAAGAGLVLWAAAATAAGPAPPTAAEAAPVAPTPVAAEPAELVRHQPGPSPAGSLPGERTRRPMGLPVVLAATGVLGVGSLLVRVLLAEPAARRAPAAPDPPRRRARPAADRRLGEAG